MSRFLSDADLDEMHRVLQQWADVQRRSDRRSANAGGATLYAEHRGRLEGRPVDELTVLPEYL